jgi:hypothetical protein
VVLRPLVTFGLLTVAVAAAPRARISAMRCRLCHSTTPKTGPRTIMTQQAKRILSNTVWGSSPRFSARPMRRTRMPVGVSV